MVQRKILITGASGFIGSNIVKNISKSNKIFIISRDKKRNNSQKNLRFINYKNFDELNSKLKKIKIDIVIHCATHYVKEHSYSDIQKFANSNILFGNIILENLNKMKVKKFINLSTVWENYNSIKDDNPNLYSVYKKIFSHLINFYKKKIINTSFYNIMLSDTFGVDDKRSKIINALKDNYKINKKSTIISKNLYLNLLNVEDIVDAINMIVKKDIKPGQYLLKNTKDYKIEDIIEAFNKFFKRKIIVHWVSNKIIKQKIYPYKKLNNWTPKKSKLKDILKIISN